MTPDRCPVCVLCSLGAPANQPWVYHFFLFFSSQELSDAKVYALCISARLGTAEAGHGGEDPAPDPLGDSRTPTVTKYSILLLPPYFYQ